MTCHMGSGHSSNLFMPFGSSHYYHHLYQGWMVVGAATSKVVSGIWYQFVTVQVHADCIVLPHWEIRHYISHSVTWSWDWASESLPYLINAECQTWNQFDINLIIYWFDSSGNRTPDLPHARSALSRLGHHDRFFKINLISPNIVYCPCYIALVIAYL